MCATIKGEKKKKAVIECKSNRVQEAGKNVGTRENSHFGVEEKCMYLIVSLCCFPLNKPNAVSSK